MMQVGEICEACLQSTSGQCPKHTVLVTFTPTTIPWPPTFTFTPFQLAPQGWQCPCCKTIYAPHIPSCGCASTVSVYTTTSTGAQS